MTVHDYTINDLISTLRLAAGESAAAESGAEILDTPFDALGYDSLALLETGARIERERGIRLPDSIVIDAGTPRVLLASINERLRAIA